MSLDPRRHAFRPDLADERLQGKVDAGRFVSGETRRINTTLAALHREPSPTSGMDTQALFGESIRVFEEKDGWAWAQLMGDDYVGYIRTSDIGPDKGEPTHRVAAMRSFIYPTASIKLPTDRYLSIGSQMRVIAIEGDFAAIAGGGFIYRTHLTELATREPDFVAVTERFVGTPYLWGGKSSLGIDCSGLVQLSLAQTGIMAPRDSNMQEAELGQEITITPDLSGLRRGDFIFWKGHITTMVDETRIIHANGWSMTVLVEPLAVAEKRTREATGGGITRIRRL